jgi:hypothetical protein
MFEKEKHGHSQAMHWFWAMRIVSFEIATPRQCPGIMIGEEPGSGIKMEKLQVFQLVETAGGGVSWRQLRSFGGHHCRDESPSEPLTRDNILDNNDSYLGRLRGLPGESEGGSLPRAPKLLPRSGR